MMSEGSRDYRCLVMMASYNGEKYIKDQIESILSQKDISADIVIQDDGSVDGTIDIIRGIMEKDERVSLLINDTDNHGPYQNFNILVNRVREFDKQYDFYLFADQDDLWDEDKLLRFISFYEKSGIREDEPALIYGNMRVMSDEGDIIIPDMNEETGIKRDAKSMFFDASVWGCNFFFNRALLMDITKVPDDAKRVWGHDQYFARWAGIRGRLLFMDDITMSYRRYTGSVTSEHELTTSAGRIMKRLGRIDALAADHAVMYKSGLFVLERLLESDLSDDARKKAEGIKRCIDRGGLYAIGYYIKNRIDLGKRVRTISHLVILVSCLYKKHLRTIV